MAFGAKNNTSREPTYGQERDIHNIRMAVDELSGVLRRSRDSERMRTIIKQLHALQQHAAAALVAED
jgi:hypothetical protein